MVRNLSNCPLLGTESDLLQDVYLPQFLSFRYSVPPYLYRFSSSCFDRFLVEVPIQAYSSCCRFTFGIIAFIYIYCFIYIYLCFVSSVLSFSCRLSSDLSICSSRTCSQSFFVRSIFLVFYLTYFCYLLLSPTVDHVWICS